MVEIGRLLTAMVTPFTAEGAVDYAQAGRLALALLESGSDGVVVAGTTGEAPTLTGAEKLALFSEVKKAVGGGGVVMAGTSTYNTAESVELTREAVKTGVDGFLLTTPYYNRPTQEGLFRHFEVIARTGGLPCILYNIPGRTGVNLAVETVVRLSRIPNIVGIKEASGDLKQVARIVGETREDFRVWSGDDADTLPILSVGGYGVIAVVSHLAGNQLREMIDSYLAGRVEEASRIHRGLLPLMTVLMTAASNPIPIKHALNVVGFRVGGVRLPLVEPDQVTGERIAAEGGRQRIDLPVAV